MQPDRVVVGAAVVRAGRVLAARRCRPAWLAGGWEFPGGKVEEGETPRAALARECREELGVEVAVGAWLARADVRPGLVLEVYLAELRSGEPRPLVDHDALRWLAPAELDEVGWLGPDRPAVEAVRRLLAVTD